MDLIIRLQACLSIFVVWKEMVKDHEVYRGKKLKLHKKQIFPSVWKQGENFKPLGSFEKSQKKKITHVKKSEGRDPEFQTSSSIEEHWANYQWQNLVKE